jgi:hypothetical protein
MVAVEMTLGRSHLFTCIPPMLRFQRSNFMRKLSLPYDGPQSGLVWCNLMIAAYMAVQVVQGSKGAAQRRLLRSTSRRDAVSDVVRAQ